MPQQKLRLNLRKLSRQRGFRLYSGPQSNLNFQSKWFRVCSGETRQKCDRASHFRCHINGEKHMFKQFGFSEKLLKSIQAAGFEKPSLIQEKVMPLIMQGRDLVGQAKTGTGKTAAFGLPALERRLFCLCL